MAVSNESLVITNAAGMVKTREQAQALLGSAVTRITIGSITKEPRAGNIGTRYYYDPVRKTAWNSVGLDNPGADSTALWLPQFRQECEDAGKVLCVSVAGFSPTEYADLAERFLPLADVVELNAGCGNVWKANEQKPIPSYHPTLLEEVLHVVGDRFTIPPLVTLKFSPVPDVDTIHAAAKVIENSGIVSEVIVSNTLPNQVGEHENGKPVLAWRESEDALVKHVGGMSGAELLPLSEETGMTLYSMLPRSIRLTGCGGIFTGEDVASSATSSPGSKRSLSSLPILTRRKRAVQKDRPLFFYIDTARGTVRPN